MARIVVCSSLTKIATANYFVKAFKKLGNDVFVLSDIRSSSTDIKISSFDDIGDALKKNRFIPDLFVFIEGGSMRLFPRGLQNLECITAWYGIDTHMDYEKHLRISRLFDVSFVAQKQYVDRLRADGIRSVFWLPLGFDGSIVPEEPLERIYDVSFVGSNNPVVHPERAEYLNQISSNFPNHLFVNNATPIEMGKIYAQSKIVFNKSVNNDLNMRYFEALGAGACLVTDPIYGNGVDEIFKKEEDFFLYEDVNSLVRVIQNLLSSPNLVEQVSKSVKKKIAKNHTYNHRATQLLETICSVDKLDPPNFLDYFAVYICLRLYPLALSTSAKCFAAHENVGVKNLIEVKVIQLYLMILVGAAKVGLIFSNLTRRVLKR